MKRKFEGSDSNVATEDRYNSSGESELSSDNSDVEMVERKKNKKKKKILTLNEQARKTERENKRKAQIKCKDCSKLIRRSNMSYHRNSCKKTNLILDKEPFYLAVLNKDKQVIDIIRRIDKPISEKNEVDRPKEYKKLEKSLKLFVTSDILFELPGIKKIYKKKVNVKIEEIVDKIQKDINIHGLERNALILYLGGISAKKAIIIDRSNRLETNQDRDESDPKKRSPIKINISEINLEKIEKEFKVEVRKLNNYTPIHDEDDDTYFMEFIQSDRIQKFNFEQFGKLILEKNFSSKNYKNNWSTCIKQIIDKRLNINVYIKSQPRKSKVKLGTEDYYVTFPNADLKLGKQKFEGMFANSVKELFKGIYFKYVPLLDILKEHLITLNNKKLFLNNLKEVVNLMIAKW